MNHNTSFSPFGKSAIFWLFIIILSLNILILSGSPHLTRARAGDVLQVIDKNGEGIYPGEIQYFAIWNDAETTEVQVNVSTGFLDINQSLFPVIFISVFSWDDYFPGKELGLVNNVSNPQRECSVVFTCMNSTRYLIRLENLDDDDIATYNITFITGGNVYFP
ncbi:MAG: hypothetical protein ACTSWN_10590 [Promethearchaeota archaeon]